MAKEIHMQTNEMELKAVAKAAGAALKRSGHQVPHSALLHALSAALNKRDWHKLKASLMGAPQAAGDTPSGQPHPALPAKNQEIELLWQGKGDGTVKAFEVNGMLVVPSPEGATYVRREDAKAFFGLSEPAEQEGDRPPPQTEIRKTLEGVRSYLETPGDLNAEEVRHLLEDVEFALRALSVAGPEPLAAGVHLEPPKALSAEALEGPAVSATFWTDDHVCEVTFDCRAYLAQADEKALRGIFEVGFSGDYCTDDVAQFNYGNPELDEGFKYLNALQQSPRCDIGFECRVDRDDYLAWMDQHRQGLLAEILCDSAGVLVWQVKDAEREDGNEWGWEIIEEGAAVADSNGLFATKRDACVDAYRELSLLEQAKSLQI